MIGDAEQKLALVIHDGIKSGRYKAGSRIPTEREFALSLGIARSVVRRTLAALESQGRIVRHVGRGTFVAADFQADEMPIGLATSPAEIMAVRLILEPQIAPLAAASGTSADFERMFYCLGESENALAYDEFERWDGSFHRTIAEATHNHFLLRIFNVVNAVRDEPLWGNLKRHSFTRARRRCYEDDHRRIAVALQQRDGELGRQLMREHILRVRDNLLGAADG